MYIYIYIYIHTGISCMRGPAGAGGRMSSLSPCHQVATIYNENTNNNSCIGSSDDNSNNDNRHPQCARLAMRATRLPIRVVLEENMYDELAVALAVRGERSI